MVFTFGNAKIKKGKQTLISRPCQSSFAQISFHKKSWNIKKETITVIKATWYYF